MSGVDQIELLSRLALRTILGLHTFGTENHNPQLHAHELEFLQAVALSRPRSRNAGAFAMTQALDRILPLVRPPRSEARRVGNECVSTCRYRWSQYDYINKIDSSQNSI